MFALCRNPLRAQRLLQTVGRLHTSVPSSDWAFFPDFLNRDEQRTLLQACLDKLDGTESREGRKRRRAFLAGPEGTTRHGEDGCFLPDALYEFQEGHYDGVIRRYREMHASTWPSSTDLDALLGRIQELLPARARNASNNLQWHILHLASDGFIEPHIDNVGASGSWILGVSLGSTRDMLLESEQPHARFRLELPPGSIYIQRDSVRYNYKHSILPGEHQRLSLMIRVSATSDDRC